MNRGEIWLAQVGRKRRPVLVLTRSQVIDVRERVTVAEVTTSIRNIAAEVAFEHHDAGLDQPSVINCDGIHTVAQASLTHATSGPSAAPRWRRSARRSATPSAADSRGVITVGAGCRWNAVLPATLAEGLMPPVLPDYIGQTVGGTLSVGGIGAMSFREGAQIDHVVACAPSPGTAGSSVARSGSHRELFEMLLAGQGQVGVIVEATLRLVPAPSTCACTT